MHALKKHIRHAYETMAALSPPTAGSIVAPLFDPNTPLPTLLNSLFKTAIVVGGILAVLRIAWAGFVYMTSESFNTKGDAKKIIQDAILGLMLLMGIWLILNQINPEILNLNILRSVPSSSSAPGGDITGCFGSGCTP